MIDQLSASLNFYSQALDLRAKRQNVLASNIANSDTPNYKARDFDFKNALDAAIGGSQTPGLAMDVTHAGHIAGSGPNSTGEPRLAYRNPDQPSLDGNTVDMDVERVDFMDNALHYRADLQILGDQIKGLKQAMQPER
ncbi:MAG: flagellar basal body rod protein FlgB [Salinisphaera sp.]|jgi:flagellar basal-body rod protein FlgB|nr:flagellar basal body rod protein FlgB [Salinisphaera sp.]